MRKATNQPRCPVCNVASSATLVSRRDLKPAGEDMEKLVSCVRGLQEIVARPRPPSGADAADAAAAAAAEAPGDAPEAADEPSSPPPPTAKAKPRAKSKAKPKAKDSKGKGKGKGKAKPRAKGRAARPAAEAPDAPAPEPAPAPRGRSRRAPAADLADYDENEALKRALLESAAEARTDRQRRRPGNDDGALAAAAAGANTELKRLQFNNPGRKQTVAAGFSAARVFPGQEESGEQSQQDGDSQQENGEEAEQGELGHQGPEQDQAQEDNHDAQHAEDDDDEPEQVQEFAVGEPVFALYPPEKKKFGATVRAWSAERAEYTVECEHPLSLSHATLF